MSNSLEFVGKVLGLLGGGQTYKYGYLDEAIWWRTDEKYAPITFFVGCNDLFYWACADAEELTEENFPRLKEAIIDVRKAWGCPLEEPKYPHASKVDEPYIAPSKEAIDKYNEHHEKHWDSGSWGVLLFCARERKMRPQKPYYELIPTELHALFDACGPERDPKNEG